MGLAAVGLAAVGLAAVGLEVDRVPGDAEPAAQLERPGVARGHKVTHSSSDTSAH